MTTPDLLGVVEVMARYGMRDRRAARAVMDAAGAFKVGARVFVRVDALLAHEDALAAQRRSEAPVEVGATIPLTTSGKRRRRPQTAAKAPLDAGWWRQAG